LKKREGDFNERKIFLAYFLKKECVMMQKMAYSKKRKSWLEIRLEIPRSYTELVSTFLFSQGSPGLIQEKIGKNKERFIAYFSQ